MRTTVDLDDDVMAAVDELRSKESIGLSAAVNRLAKAGLVTLSRSGPAERFAQPTAKIGVRVDVRNVAEALEQLDGAEFR